MVESLSDQIVKSFYLLVESLIEPPARTESRRACPRHKAGKGLYSLDSLFPKISYSAILWAFRPDFFFPGQKIDFLIGRRQNAGFPFFPYSAILMKAPDFEPILTEYKMTKIGAF